MTEPSAIRLPGVLWHVTVTLHGRPHSTVQIQKALQELLFNHGVAMSARYSDQMVELRYWDEGKDCNAVADQGLDLWDELRRYSELPGWAVVGLEVLERSVFRRRWPPGSAESGQFHPGVHPWGVPP